jgi:hypothetical protein
MAFGRIVLRVVTTFAILCARVDLVRPANCADWLD